MTRLLSLILILSLSGCLQPVPKGGDPESTPSVTSTVTAAELGEALARRVEAGDPMTTQHVYRLAQLALKDASLSIDLGPAPKNEPLTDELRKEWAAKFRGWR